MVKKILKKAGKEALVIGGVGVAIGVASGLEGASAVGGLSRALPIAGTAVAAKTGMALVNKIPTGKKKSKKSFF